MEYRTFIGQGLTKASQIALFYFGKVTETVKTGDHNQVSTEADLKVGSYLIDQIKTTFPNHNIIDEEAGVFDHGSDFTWVIDPIDGTSNFAKGVPTYGITLGLLYKNIPLAGGIALPYFKEIIIAEKEIGAFANGEKIKVTEETNLLSALIAYGLDGHRENPEQTRTDCKILAEIALSVRNIRSSHCVFDYIMTAKGKYGGFLGKTSRIWDCVGPQIIIEEAGGKYTDFFGQPMNYKNPLKKSQESFSWCCASPILHQQLQKIIHEIIN